jgi:hypothetical protein
MPWVLAKAGLIFVIPHFFGYRDDAFFLPCDERLQGASLQHPSWARMVSRRRSPLDLWIVARHAGLLVVALHHFLEVPDSQLPSFGVRSALQARRLSLRRSSLQSEIEQSLSSPTLSCGICGTCPSRQWASILA